MLGQKEVGIGSCSCLLAIAVGVGKAVSAGHVVSHRLALFSQLEWSVVEPLLVSDPMDYYVARGIPPLFLQNAYNLNCREL